MRSTSSATARPVVRLPPMPDEREAAAAFSPIDMAIGHIEGDQLAFKREDGFARALRDGFFLLAMPSGVDLEAGDRFANHFFLPSVGGPLASYTGYRDLDVPGDYQGYFDRSHDQWENFYIERANWRLLPREVALLGRSMAHIGVTILRSTLAKVGIPQAEWSVLTGGLSEGDGHQMLAFNHFRSDKPARGSKFHRDSGWVTVLRSTEPGLVGYIGNELRSINPEPGHFIVNFGSSIEVLTEGLSLPVRANVHGVARTRRQPGQSERVSYVTFLDSDLDADIYRYGPHGREKLQTVAEFAVQEVSRTYDDDDLTL